MTINYQFGDVDAHSAPAGPKTELQSRQHTNQPVCCCVLQLTSTRPLR